MCLTPSPPRDNSAQIARQAEEARQARIREGTQQVNDIFSQFDDDYYDSIQSASDEFYLPQVKDQYEDARRALVLNLGSSGTLNGSAGARRLGSLDERYNQQRADISQRGVATAQQYRGDVERNKSEVISQLNASADPVSAAAAARSRAEGLQAPPTFSLLGNLFGEFLNLGGNALAVEASGRGPGFNTGLFNNSTDSGSGSLKVVS